MFLNELKLPNVQVLSLRPLRISAISALKSAVKRREHRDTQRSQRRIINVYQIAVTFASYCPRCHFDCRVFSKSTDENALNSRGNVGAETRRRARAEPGWKVGRISPG